MNRLPIVTNPKKFIEKSNSYVKETRKMMDRIHKEMESGEFPIKFPEFTVEETKNVIHQLTQERDIAIQQLESLGYQFGEKIELEYKGFCTVPRIDFEDNNINGKILYIRDLVDFEAETPSGFVEEFHRAVDDYLKFKSEISRK